MFLESNDTFTFLLFIRTFSFSDRNTTTEKTLSFNNTDFIGDDLIINYTNT